MRRYVTIGRSWITDAFIEGAARTGKWELYGVYSRSRQDGEAFAARHGVFRVYPSIAEVAADDRVDGVYVASPNVCHVAQCRELLQAGKHVLCEKPLAAHAADVRELQQLAAERGVVYLEAIMYMHTPARDILRDAVARTGRVSVARLDFCQRSSKYDAYRAGSLPNIFNPAMETGALMDLGVYCVYPAVDLFGPPQEVVALATLLESGADGAGSALLRYPDKQVVLTYSKTAESGIHSEFAGDAGTVTVGSISKVADIAFVPTGGTPQTLAGDEERAVLMGHEAENWYRFIEDPADPLYARCRETALWTAEVMETIRQKAGIRFPSDN